MTSSVIDLVRVTVRTPDRRLDVALPDGVAIAALLPVLLRDGGTELADRGAGHGGWVLRDVVGTPLDTGRGLGEQGIHDGDLLCLGLADEAWPEMDYDDVVEAVAEASARRSGRWGTGASRVASLVAAGLLLVGAFLALWGSAVRAASPEIALGLAALLDLGAVVAARAYRRGDAASVLGGAAALFAFAGGWLAAGRFVGAGTGGGARTMVACAAVMVAVVVAGIGTARPGPVSVAGGTAALFGLIGGTTAMVVSPARAAAVVLGVVALTSGLAPSVATRIGGLPHPGGLPRPDAAGTRPLPGRAGAVDTDRIFAAVTRTDAALAGLLSAAAVAGGPASVVLASSGGWSGRILVGLVATGLALRARVYAGIAHRTVALAAAGTIALPLLVSGLYATSAGLEIAAALTAAALVVIITGTADPARSPYLGRIGDILEVLSIAMVVPTVCLVLGLYGRLRGVHP